MNKEEIYDAQISPLMLQIIEICKSKGIAMIASFDIGHDGEGPNGEDCTGLLCSSLTPDGDGNPNPAFQQAFGLIKRGRYASPGLHVTTQHADGTRTLAAII